MSADAEAAASKAAADAESAASAAADAAKKAEAAKHLSETYVAEAEKWFSATDVPADAAIASAQQLTAEPASAAGAQAGSSGAPVNASAAASAAAAGSTGTAKMPAALPSPGQLPAALVPAINKEWQALEHVYVQGMSRGFSGLRKARHLALNHVAKSCSWFQAFLKRGDSKQQILQSFIERFNAVELDMRRAKETQVSEYVQCLTIVCLSWYRLVLCNRNSAHWGSKQPSAFTSTQAIHPS